ncbi:MAG: hypothetical protein J7J98_06200 [candidate division Zixibacteria bacterium]|nr:hypothetical protein [candidate division Zixibacteria bacterium]
MSRRTRAVLSIFGIVVVVSAVVVPLYGYKILDYSIAWARGQYHAYEHHLKQRRPQTTRNAFMYLGADGTCPPDKLIAYANGSVAVGSYPYVIGTALRLDSDADWQLEQTRSPSEFNWRLADRYLPISISEYTYQTLSCASRVFCLPERRNGKTSVGMKDVTLVNSGDQPVTVSIETTIRFSQDQQHLSLGFEHGYWPAPTPTTSGLYYRLGAGGVLLDVESNPITVTLDPGQAFTTRCQILFGSDATIDDHLVWTDFTSEYEQTVAHWRSRMSGIAKRIPESNSKYEALAALVHILQACDNAIRPTLFYRSAFIRDGAVISHCLLEAGFTDLAKAQVDYYLNHPWSSGFGPEGDAPGCLVWMAGDYVRHTADTAYVHQHWSIMQANAEIILDMYRQPASEVGGLTISEYHGPILWGRMDSAMRPVFCNVWLLAGLREAAYLASVCGDSAAQQRYRWAYETNRTVLIEYMSENPDVIRKHVRAFIAGVHPTKVFDPESKVIRELYDLRWPDNNEYVASQWPYFDLAQATASHLVGRPDRSETIYRAICKRYPYHSVGGYITRVMTTSTCPICGQQPRHSFVTCTDQKLRSLSSQRYPQTESVRIAFLERSPQRVDEYV